MMACADASRKLLAALVMLTFSPSMARGQATLQPTPKDPPGVHTHVQLEAKPPDEPTTSPSPDVEMLPDTAPSSSTLPPPDESEQDDDTGKPMPAELAAHPPEIETYVVPVYPAKARAKKIEGRVLLMVVIDESGKVEDDIQVVDSIPMLDQAALDAVHQWTFTPARDDGGNPVRVWLKVGVPFSLR